MGKVNSTVNLMLRLAGIVVLLVLPVAAQESDSSEKAGSIWDALNDLADEVEKLESGEPPDYGPIRMVTSGGAYPPGRFTGTCTHYARPEKYSNGDRWTTIAIDTHFYRRENGVWNGVGKLSKVHYVGMFQECSQNEDYLWLGDPADPVRGPGQYKMVVEGYEQSYVVRKDLPRPQGRKEIRKEIIFQIVEEPGECANADVIITNPYDRYQISFDASADGRLEFGAEAMVSPADCAREVFWSADAIGDTEATIKPPTGEKVSISYEGLSEYNDDFGPLRISARILGAGESREVLAFFDPQATNHPGEGAGETPNWFYYWGQTSAQGEFSEPRYVEKMPRCSATDDIAQARYVYDDDVIYMADKAYLAPCLRRQGDVIDTGRTAEGIDCFAELIRHEGVHQIELKRWWAPFNGEASPAMCGPSAGWVVNRIAGIDSDGDLVPDLIENPLSQSRGCDPNNDRSCSGRPQVVNVSENGERTVTGPIDVEMNAYTAGWNAWKLGHADNEDWSKCGAQWTDKSGCSYE